MKTSLDCIPCFIRQTLDAARLVSIDPADQERIVRDVLRWAVEIDLTRSPPVVGQRIYRQLREITGRDDPYRSAKEQQNRIAMSLWPDLKAEVDSAEDPLAMAIHLAIVGNVIDMGTDGNLTESDVRQSINQALLEPLPTEWNGFHQAVVEAQSILYLADNAGEIVFDRLLIEQLSPQKVTLAVRGAPVINDATLDDAHAVGLNEIVEVIDNGSDVPGTDLDDCSDEFRERFETANLILAKGQGNFETLNDEPGNIYFLFKVKCPVIASYVNMPVGAHVLTRSNARL